MTWLASEQQSGRQEKENFLVTTASISSLGHTHPIHRAPRFPTLPTSQEQVDRVVRLTIHFELVLSFVLVMWCLCRSLGEGDSIFYWHCTSSYIAERCFDFILDNLQLVSSYKRDSTALINCPSRVTQRFSIACTSCFMTKLSIF
jgi:hypothetical protein